MWLDHGGIDEIEVRIVVSPYNGTICCSIILTTRFMPSPRHDRSRVYSPWCFEAAAMWVACLKSRKIGDVSRKYDDLTLPHKKRMESPNRCNCSTLVWTDRHVKLEYPKVVGEELESLLGNQLRQVDGSVKWVGNCLYRFLLLPGAAGRDVQLSLGLKGGGIWWFSRFREMWNHREAYPIQ